MRLIVTELATLYFPESEWHWLRAPVRLADANTTPDAFVWAAEVDGKLWAWSTRGGNVTPGTSISQKTRALVVKTDGSELEAHSLYLKTSFEALPPHETEWVAALQTLEHRLGHSLSQKELPKYWCETLRLCGLEEKPSALDHFRRFEFLLENELQHLFLKQWPLATLEQLKAMSATVRASAMTAIRSYDLSAANSREVVSSALILAKTMSEKAAITVLSTEYQNGEELRMALFRTAQPELAALAQRRIEALRDLKLPARSAIYGDPSFESDTLKITHNPRKTTDFELFRDWVSAPETLEKIRSLLEIYTQ